MRDAGAKVAVELTDQESVRLLIRNAGAFPLTLPPAPDAKAPDTPPAERPAETAPEETPPVKTAPEETPPAETPTSGTGVP
jgi:hypothetical protein